MASQLNKANGKSRRGSGLYGQVVDVLGQSIVDGSMYTGQIVFADQLTEQLGVSRSVVREGLRALSSMGLIEARPQVGTTVLPSSSWDLLNPQVVTWRGQSGEYLQQTRDLLELRLGIEPTAARLAATRILTPAAEAFLATGNEMRVHLESGDRHAFFRADSAFHRQLLEGSGNAVLAQFSDTIDAALQSRARDTQPVSAELNLLSLERHIDLAKAVLDRDPAGAERFARLIVEETLLHFNEAWPQTP